MDTAVDDGMDLILVVEKMVEHVDCSGGCLPVLIKMRVKDDEG